MAEHGKDASQRAELRERILVTATEAFASKGIKSITMDDIAAALGISKRTLYEVFSDKESLLKECILKAQSDREAYLQEVYEQSHNVLEVILAVFQKSIEVFHQTNKRFFEDIKKYPKVYSLMRDRQDSDSEKTMSFFKAGVEQGIFRSDVNFGIVNMLVKEQFDVLLNTDICNEYPFIEVYECSPIFVAFPQRKERRFWKTLYKNIVKIVLEHRESKVYPIDKQLRLN